MTEQHAGYRWQQSTLLLDIYVQPNAKQEGFDGWHNQRIKLRIGAPATDGKANKRLIALLSNIFDAPKRSIEVIKGEKSRNKVISIKLPGILPSWISP